MLSAQKAHLNIRVEKETKEKFDILCQNIGISVSSAISVFLRRSVLENRIPIELTANIPNEVTLAALKESDEMIKSGSGKEFKTLAEMRAYDNEEI